MLNNDSGGLPDMFEDGNIWVLIPLAAIIIGGFFEYLKVRAKQQRLGDSTKETENRLETINNRLEKQNRDLVRRIQNLEAIVTSQTWDEIHGLPGRPESSARDHRRASTDTVSRHQAAETGPLLDDALEADHDDASDERRAEELARRLRNH